MAKSGKTKSSKKGNDKKLDLDLDLALSAVNGEKNDVQYRIIDITNPENSFVVKEYQQLSNQATSSDQQSTNNRPISRTRQQTKMSSQGHSLKRKAPVNQIENTKNREKEEKKIKHNEIERKRRDKINNWIIKLSKIVPECQDDSTKQSQSKGVILNKACEYITGLKRSNTKLSNANEENISLRKELSQIKKENASLTAEVDNLKELLKENGIAIKKSKK